MSPGTLVSTALVFPFDLVKVMSLPTSTSEKLLDLSKMHQICEKASGRNIDRFNLILFSTVIMLIRVWLITGELWV